jgi:hypothetical protein
MIGVITIIVVGITLIVGSIIRMNKTNKRIKELEKRLTDYYIQREKRLKDKGLIKRGPEWPE